ncbi:MAG: PEP-CTERM sorting domain-containing protein [Phycisphaerae bacterium]
MTIVTLAAIAGLLVAGSASAEIVVSDGFETSASPSASQYEADANLSGQDPNIAGFSDAWDGTNFERFATRATGITGFFADEAAGGLQVTQEGSNTTRDWTRTITGDPAEASKTYWFAFSANFAETTGGGVSMGYSVDNDPVDIGMENGTFTYKTAGDGDTQDLTFGTAEANTDYLFISSLDITGFGGGTDETFNVWVFSADDFAAWDKQESTLDSAATATLGEQTANIMYNDGADSGLSQARVEYIEPGDGNTLFGTQLDEYRISSDFDSLGVVPEPATMSLLALGGLGALLKRKR